MALLESEESFQVYYQKPLADDASKPFGLPLNSIEAVRKRIALIKSRYIGVKCRVTRTTYIIEEIDPETFNK